MLSPTDDNFQFSYQLLLLFLSRPDEQGYMFCRADDQRFMPRINNSLKKDIEENGKTCALLFLDKSSDKPLLQQIETAVEKEDAIIVANLFEIVNDSENGGLYLTQLNFAREALWQLQKPILFWADGRSMTTIANQAPDLYSQRSHTTVHFTGVADDHIVQRLNKEGWETFLSSQEFANIEANIQILEKRLTGAEKSNYSKVRAITEIVLPLAAEYAKLGMAEEARDLLSKYDDFISGSESEQLLQQLADIRYTLHEYDQAIALLNQANNLIEDKNSENNYPINWFRNIQNITHWSIEAGKTSKLLSRLMKAIAILNENRSLPWHDEALAIMHGMAGDIEIQTGKILAAKNHIESANSSLEKLVAEYPNSKRLQHQLRISYNRLGDILMAVGNFNEARVYYGMALKIAEHLVALDPHSEDLQRALGISFEHMGQTSENLGNLVEAQKYYEQSLKISEKLAVANPHSEQLKRDHALSLDRLGIIAEALNNYREANDYYQQALQIKQELTSINPYSEQLQRDQTLSFIQLGTIAESLGNLNEANSYYERALGTSEKLAAENRDSEQLKRDQVLALARLGAIAETRERLQTARNYYEKALKISKDLTISNPHSEQLQRDLALTYIRLGMLSKKNNHNTPNVIQHYEDARKILEQLSLANPFSQQLKTDVRFVHGKLQELRDSK